ncbi:hypothetical protein ACROYT_G015313 [Oculina patagonica]
MAEGSIRNSDWEDDEELKSDLQRYVLQNLMQWEIQTNLFELKRSLTTPTLPMANHTHSADGHDKLMGNGHGLYKKHIPLALYGLQDVFSDDILYLKIWTSNSDPKLDEDQMSE